MADRAARARLGGTRSIEERGASRHLRDIARHGLRVVRLLSLRHAGAVLRGAVLSGGQRHGRAAVGVRHVRRGFSRPAVRCDLLRPHRRSRRPQVHLSRHHTRDGRLDVPGGPAADLRGHRMGRASPARDAAAGPGAGARRRIRRRGDLPRRARARPSPRLRHELDPDHGNARLLRRLAGDRMPCVSTWMPRSSPSGAGASRS